jgi:hypothetical protein
MSATRSADSRYIHDLIARCETTHLAGHLVHLSRIVVEPRFITGPELAAPPEDDVKHDVFYVAPRFPDHPYLLAPVNVETLSIDELSRGDRSIALLGLPGSGRTTALLTIALWSLGQVRFEQPKDKVQEHLDQKKLASWADERTCRAKERLMLEQRQRAFSEEGNQPGEDGEGDSGRSSQRLMPIYVHLANMHLAPGAFEECDPAEPLVRAVQSQVKRVTAKTLPRNMYNRLNQGQARVMLDGLDDLPGLNEATGWSAGGVSKRIQAKFHHRDWPGSGLRWSDPIGPDAGLSAPVERPGRAARCRQLGAGLVQHRKRKAPPFGCPSR